MLHGMPSLLLRSTLENEDPHLLFQHLRQICLLLDCALLLLPHHPTRDVMLRLRRQTKPPPHHLRDSVLLDYRQHSLHESPIQPQVGVGYSVLYPLSLRQWLERVVRYEQSRDHQHLLIKKHNDPAFSSEVLSVVSVDGVRWGLWIDGQLLDACWLWGGCLYSRLCPEGGGPSGLAI